MVKYLLRVFPLSARYYFRIFKEIRNFCTDFRKNTQISNLIQIGQMGVELFHADGLT